MGKNPDLLHGTMNMLILKAVSLGPLHGYAVLLRIQQLAADRLEIQQGTLYPALYRLEHQGLLKGKWGESENNRRARFYSLTAAGRRELAAERAKWEDMAELIAGILNAEAPEGGAA
jgi:PadR family transcriptional regulator PadR